MKLLKSDKAKVEIIKLLYFEGEMTYHSIMNKVSLNNFESVKKACDFLNKISIVEINTKKAGKREYNYVRLSETGKNIAKFLLSK